MLFGCPVHFERAANRMNFSSLAVPIASADSLIAGRSRAFMTLQKSVAGAFFGLEAAVVRALRIDLRQTPALRDIAASVHLTERTLRRRLAQKGLAFTMIVDRERMRHALQLMREGQITLIAVATATGFADERSLRRATLRWTGHTPTQIRAANILTEVAPQI